MDRFHSVFRPWLVAPVPKTAHILPYVEGRSYAYFAIFVFIFVLCISAAANGGPKGSGNVADFVGFVLIVFSVRNLPIFSAAAISFDKYIEVHKILGISLVFVFIIHASLAGWRTTGFIMAVLLGFSSLLYLTVKQLKFELFYYPHIALYLIFVPVGLLHGATVFSIAILIWAADFVFRYYRRGTKVEATLTVIGQDVVHVEFTKAIDFSSGQYMFLVVPAVHPFEAHPFSIASAAYCDTVNFYIKRSGDWTQKLFNAVSACEGGRSVTVMNCEGPYGSRHVAITSSPSSPHSPVPRHQVLLLAAGGIGITPILSILQDVVQQQQNEGARAVYNAGFSGDRAGGLFKKIIVLWTVRDPDLAQHVYEKIFVPLLADDSKFDSCELETATGGATTVQDIDDDTSHGWTEEVKLGHRKLYTEESSSSAEIVKSPFHKQLVDDDSNNRSSFFKTRPVSVSSPNTVIELVLHMSLCKSEQVLEKMFPALPALKKTANGWRSGRPAIKQLVKETAAIARGLQVGQVGVVTCGPVEFVRKVRSSVEEYRQPFRSLTGKIFFDYHEEQFML